MKSVSKSFYLSSIIGGLGSGILLSRFSVLLTSSNVDAMVIMGGILLIASLGLLVYGIVILALLVYKMWKCIQAGSVRTTPGKAVGFLFIPLFNFYWIFQSYWGWTKDFNKYVSDKNLNSPNMPEGVALALCITTLCAMIPFLGILATIASIVLMIIFLNKAINGINSLAEQTT